MLSATPPFRAESFTLYKTKCFSKISSKTPEFSAAEEQGIA
jgi:hypothetical protein